MLFYHITIEHVVEETMLHSLEKNQTKPNFAFGVLPFTSTLWHVEREREKETAFPRMIIETLHLPFLIKYLNLHKLLKKR